MLKIIRFLWGYVVFTANGVFPERFINLAAKSGVSLFDVKKRGTILYCSTMASEYRALRRIAKKSDIKIRIKEKYGFPFFIRQYKKRKGIFVGIICFGLTLYFLSLYIWSIDVQGATTLDKNELNNLISDLGISAGTLKSELDTPMLEKTIMKNFDNISWVSVNIKGSVLSFELKERVAPPKIIPKTAPCNVKSSSDGQIIRMEIYQGTPEVKYGDAVVKGQLLINGFVEDDFGTCNIRHADGKVFALTKHELKKEVELCQTEKQSTGKTVVRKRLKLFGVEVPLTLVSVPGKDYEKSVQTNNVSLFGVSLPVSYYKEVWTQVYDKKVVLSSDDALIKANEELEKAEKDTLKDAKIISKDKKEKVENGKAIVAANYVCEENIAVQEEIFLEN